MSTDGSASSLLATLLQVVAPERIEEEQRVWSGMTPAQRARATDRLKALDRWRGGRGNITVAQAAKLADVSVSRFYRLASEWRENPSIRSLGVFAPPGAKTPTRRPKVSSAILARLASAAREAILMYGDVSVSVLAERTIGFARLQGDAGLPGATKLREIIEEERRRLQATQAMGQIILFDCVATSMPRADRRPHVAFLCIDEGTGAVLGVSIGNVNASAGGYAEAASDALRIVEQQASSWTWSNVFSVVRMTAGEDIDRMSRLVHRLNATFLEQHFILERGTKRYGRLIRKTVGPRMGRVTFTPTRTTAGDALATNGDMTPWSEADAYNALRRAADEHNAAILSDNRKGVAELPPQLSVALSTIAGEAC